MSIKMLVLTFTIASVINGCSTVPIEIRNASVENVQLIDVKSNIAAHSGKKVRWGGEIASIKNTDDKTIIEIVQFQLNSRGMPKKNGLSTGRFMVTVEKFLEPVVYQSKRLFTAVGTLDGQLSGVIGEKSYSFPIVDADYFYLWPEKSSRDDRYGYLYPYAGSYGVYSRGFIHHGGHHSGH